VELGLKNKVIMIAAASKGLGFAIAKMVAQEGAIVSIASRHADNIEKAATQLRHDTGSTVLGFVCDMSNPQSIQQWVDATHLHLGNIYGVVVNAGGPPAGTFDDIDDVTWQKSFDLTLMSAVRLIRAVLPDMKAANKGSIVTITSSAVKEPLDNLLLSNVLRTGVVGLVKSLANELGPYQIRVNNLAPGRIDTDRVRTLDHLAATHTLQSIDAIKAAQEAHIPLGSYGSPDEFGRVGAFLLSEAANYLTGVTLLVDGGKTKTLW
jgi:3-oxoacyl-[acyl-carrier protein] reductase